MDQYTQCHWYGTSISFLQGDMTSARLIVIQFTAKSVLNSDHMHYRSSGHYISLLDVVN